MLRRPRAQGLSGPFAKSTMESDPDPRARLRRQWPAGDTRFVTSRGATFGSEGIGFAVPSNVVRNVYTSLKQDGHVHRGRIGISARTITPALASAFNLKAENGVLVEDILPGGPADNAGLEV